MQCANHPDVEAVGTCTSCGRPVCSECGVDAQGKLTCRQCLAEGQAGHLDPAGVSENDRMMGLLSYVITLIVPLVILLSESSKRRPFQRYHAIHSLALSAILFVATLVLTCTVGVVLELITSGLGTCCLLPVALVPYALSIYYGVQAYQGQYAVIPVVTDFAKKQGWV